MEGCKLNNPQTTITEDYDIVVGWIKEEGKYMYKFLCAGNGAIRRDIAPAKDPAVASDALDKVIAIILDEQLIRKYTHSVYMKHKTGERTPLGPGGNPRLLAKCEGGIHETGEVKYFINS